MSDTVYRGFTIRHTENCVEVVKHGQVYTRVNTGWSAQVWIDEFLQP